MDSTCIPTQGLKMTEVETGEPIIENLWGWTGHTITIDYFEELKNIKTDFPVIIPIHENVKIILAKRNGAFPRPISEQKLNDYIKIVAKHCDITENTVGARTNVVEIKTPGKTSKFHRKVPGTYPKYELVSTHVCRRSFATNLYGKLDTMTIMKITGHKTEKQFLDYIKITPREYAEKLKEFWNKQNIL